MIRRTTEDVVDTKDVRRTLRKCGITHTRCAICVQTDGSVKANVTHYFFPLAPDTHLFGNAHFASILPIVAMTAPKE
jgi:hypothetical protein